MKNAKKIFDFEKRAKIFAKNVNDFIKKLPKNITNREYSKQLVRSSGAVGANYIEAGEALSKRDGAKYMKISRKEAKESTHWLELIDVDEKTSLDEERNYLLKESKELFYILCSMVNKLV